MRTLLRTVGLAAAVMAIACGGGEPSNGATGDASSPTVDASVVDATSISDSGRDSETDTTLDSPNDATLDAPSDSGVSLTDCATTTMGPAGGVLVHHSGAQIVVPPGALAAPTPISLCSEAAPTMTGTSPVGQAFQAGPEGQTFLVPVEVDLPFDPTLVTAGADLSTVQMRMAPVGSPTFGALQSMVALAPSFVRAQTSHFTSSSPQRARRPSSSRPRRRSPARPSASLTRIS